MVKPGDAITLLAGTKHTLAAKTNMVIIEVQIGQDIDVLDKTKHDAE